MSGFVGYSKYHFLSFYSVEKKKEKNCRLEKRIVSNPKRRIINRLISQVNIPTTDLVYCKSV
jgi:hypothetical protein